MLIQEGGRMAKVKDVEPIRRTEMPATKPTVGRNSWLHAGKEEEMELNKQQRYRTLVRGYRIDIEWMVLIVLPPLPAAHLQGVGPVARGVVGYAQRGDGMSGVHLCFRDQPAAPWGHFSSSGPHLR